MNWNDEPKQIICKLSGIGLDCYLVLHTPNNKNINDIKNIYFYNELKKFNCRKIDSEFLFELEKLKKEVSEYCWNENFFTYESQPALELNIYDYSKEVEIQKNLNSIKNIHYI